MSVYLERGAQWILRTFIIFLILVNSNPLLGLPKTQDQSTIRFYAIKRLEKEFHCPLIAHDPSHRTFKLTPQGEILLRHIQRSYLRFKGPKKRSSESLSIQYGWFPTNHHWLSCRKQPAFISNVAALQSIHPVQEGSVELLEMLSKEN